MEKITKATRSQWNKIEKIKQWWLDIPSRTLPDDQIRETVCQVWRLIKRKPLAVIIADSPISGALMLKMFRSQLNSQIKSQLDSQLSSQLHSQLYSQLKSQLDSQLIETSYVSLSRSVWAGLYEGGKLLGVTYDDAIYNLLRNWALSVPHLYTLADFPIVSRNPVEVNWHDNTLHNSTGPSVKFRDGWCLWTLNGLPVDEQIVMKPETQSIEQINKEKNQDIKSIRIERFGWTRYLKESKATCRDYRENIIENTKEALYRTKDGEQRLVVTCPTGRLFALGVPSDVPTCESAQNWLAGGKNFNVLART